MAAALTPFWNGYTNMPAYLAVSPDGQVRVAIQDSDANNNAPVPSQVVWEGDTPPIGYNPKPELLVVLAGIREAKGKAAEVVVELDIQERQLVSVIAKLP